jgi:hypothetical protein
LADPRWYKPSKFVRIDRENAFRFEISGWGPTSLKVEVYLLGKREPLRYEGVTSGREIKLDDDQFLGDPPRGDL